MKAVTPRGPLVLSVTAMTVDTSAMSPLVMKCFRPLRRYTSPFFSALVWILAASEPALGSVRAKAAVHSPLAIRGRYFSFCSGVPSIRIPWEPMPLLVPNRDRKQAFTFPNSSFRTHSPRVPRPIPPYSSGMDNPKNPISRIFCTMLSGIFSSSSTFWEIGSRSFFTNGCTVSRINRMFSGSV